MRTRPNLDGNLLRKDTFKRHSRSVKANVTNGVRILYLNARALANIVKFCTFQSVVSDYASNIIDVTETWCTKYLSDGVLLFHSPVLHFIGATESD